MNRQKFINALLIVGLNCFFLYGQSNLSYAIVDTGQLNCFNAKQAIKYPTINQSFYGQDAQYQGNTPNYADNQDGTIQDKNTGLTWQKTPEKQKYNQNGAEIYAKNSKLAGHSDWRLPTIKELFSIADFRGNMHSKTPYIDTNIFDFHYPQSSVGESGRPGQRNMDAQYCTSTYYKGITMGRDKSAFGFNFADGRIKSYPLHAKRYVRLVRGNKNYGINRFVDNSDGTITDQASGLTWQKADSSQPMNWQQALSYAESLNLAQKTDWRLPNIKELQSIVDYQKANDATKSANRGPAIDSVFSLSNPESWFWSSTTHIENQFGYYVCFGQSFSTRMKNGKKINAHGSGAVRSDPKTGSAKNWPNGLGPQADEIRITNYVRCVRGGNISLKTTGPTIMKSSLGKRNDPLSKPQSRFIKRLDKNADGKVSKSEFDGPSRAFKRLDKNGDGYIDSSEAPQGRRGGSPTMNKKDSQQSSPEFSIITVGTGSPLFNANRSSPSTMIKYGQKYILVDMGEGTANQLEKSQIKQQQIAAYCFTHHHRDHNADAMTLLPKAWARGFEGPIVGPVGTKDMAQFFSTFYKEDMIYRSSKQTNKKIPDPNVVELPMNSSLMIAGVKVTVANMPHALTNYAYRFEADNKAYVISGDLSYSEKMAEFAFKADILVIDSGGIIYSSSTSRRKNRRRSSQSMGNTSRQSKRKSPRAHSSLEEVAKMAAQAQVKKLVLTHFRPGEIDEKETIRQMRAIYQGEIVFAQDMASYQ